MVATTAVGERGGGGESPAEAATAAEGQASSSALTYAVHMNAGESLGTRRRQRAGLARGWRSSAEAGGGAGEGSTPVFSVTVAAGGSDGRDDWRGPGGRGVGAGAT